MLYKGKSLPFIFHSNTSDVPEYEIKRLLERDGSVYYSGEKKIARDCRLLVKKEDRHTLGFYSMALMCKKSNTNSILS